MEDSGVVCSNCGEISEYALYNDYNLCQECEEKEFYEQNPEAFEQDNPEVIF